MRRILAVACATLLAGCGEGDGDDFHVEVAMTPAEARTELARLDGGHFLRALNLPLITTSPTAADALAFTLPGEPDTGALQLRFEALRQDTTRIHVALDLPEQQAMIDGEMKVLVESRAEASLRKDFESWASRVRQDGFASLDDLNLALGALSMSIRSGKIGELKAAEASGTLTQHVDPRYLVSTENPGFADDADDETFGAPMMDPGAEDY